VLGGGVTTASSGPAPEVADVVGLPVGNVVGSNVGNDVARGVAGVAVSGFVGLDGGGAIGDDVEISTDSSNGGWPPGSELPEPPLPDKVTGSE